MRRFDEQFDEIIREVDFAGRSSRVYAIEYIQNILSNNNTQ